MAPRPRPRSPLLVPALFSIVSVCWLFVGPDLGQHPVFANGAATVKLSTCDIQNAEPGVTMVHLTGSGFPSGTITPGNITLSLAPSSSGPPMTAIVLAVTTISGSSREITFQVSPANQVTTPTLYVISVSGTTVEGTQFSSSNQAPLTIAPPASISSVSPASGQTGQSLAVVIKGTYSNFAQGSQDSNVLFRKSSPFGLRKYLGPNVRKSV
jgi:hypothetical protein